MVVNTKIANAQKPKQHVKQQPEKLLSKDVEQHYRKKSETLFKNKLNFNMLPNKNLSEKLLKKELQGSLSSKKLRELLSSKKLKK